MDGEMIGRSGCLLNSVQFALRLEWRNSGLEARNYEIVEIAVVRDQLSRVRHQRLEHFIAFGRTEGGLSGHNRHDWKAERLRHDADNRFRLPTDPQSHSDYRRVAMKETLPCAPGKNNLFVSSALGFLRYEGASHPWRH